MVEHIKEVSSYLEDVPLIECELLGQAEVPILLKRSAKRVARYVAIPSRGRASREWKAASHHWSRSEASWIEIAGSIDNLALYASWHVCTGNGAAEEDSGGSTATKSPATCRVGHGKWQAVLIGVDPGNAPPLKGLRSPDSALGYRQVVHIADYHSMAAIEVAHSAIQRRIQIAKVCEVGPELSHLRGIQFVCTLRSAYVVNFFRPRVGGLE